MTPLIILCWLLGGVAALIVLAQIVAWILYVPISVRIFGASPWLPAARHEPLGDGADIRFEAEDGTKLHGTYLPTTAAHRKGVIAFCHELNGDRWGTIPYTEDLRRRGFDIFTFDFRNHGQSERMPGYKPLPWVTTYELADIRAAIDYVCSRDDADPSGIGLMGVSKGGTAALCAAASDPRVRTLVVDGLCPTERMQTHFIRRFMAIYFPYPWLISVIPDVSLKTTATWTKWLVQRSHNCHFVNVDQAVRRIRRPVMFIHGRHDNYVPVALIESLRAGLRTPNDLWIVPKAKHNGSIHIAKETYHQHLATFFEQHLCAVPQESKARPSFRSGRGLLPALAAAARSRILS